VKKRILFVDDEQRILDGLRDLLYRQRRIWDMVFVTSGEQALHELTRDRFDVVVSDMRMPGMDGATLLRKIQEERPHIVRIVLSGFAELEAALRAVPVAHQFLTKPTSADDLENVIARACNLHALIGADVVRRTVGRVEKLPSLPPVYAELTRVMADERSGPRDVARVIQQDLAMCAKVLQLANSAFFGLGRCSSSIEAAVAMLGFNMIKNLVLSAELFTPWHNARVTGFCLETLQTHSLFVSLLASRMLAGHKRHAEDAFMAGMLHDIGKLVLAFELPLQLEAAQTRANREKRPLHDVEAEMFDVTHAEVGAYLLGLWGLPYSVVEAVANHHKPMRVAQRGVDPLCAVYCADQLACGRAIDPAYVASLGLADHIPAWTALAERLGQGGRA